VLRGRRPED